MVNLIIKGLRVKDIQGVIESVFKITNNTKEKEKAYYNLTGNRVI